MTLMTLTLSFFSIRIDPNSGVGKEHGNGLALLCVRYTFSIRAFVCASHSIGLISNLVDALIVGFIYIWLLFGYSMCDTLLFSYHRFLAVITAGIRGGGEHAYLVPADHVISYCIIKRP